MNESGATAFEVRQLEREIADGSKLFMNFPESYRRAILVEALNCLADKKEAERDAT